jgi:1-aminocyclopropane-1-carboxylate deaminase
MLHYQDIPTPVHLLEDAKLCLSGAKVYLKRDDLIHPFVSGNKWRKLKGYLEDAKKNDCSKLVTFGGAFSNHLIATACAGSIHGFETKAYVRGDYVDLNNPVLTLCRIFGMELLPISKDEYQNKKSQFLPIYNNEYWINEGGFGPLGTIGCAHLIEELEEDYDHIICAVGTGTTVAGLINGVKEQQKNTKIHGIAVLKNASYLNQEIDELAFSNSTNFKLHTNFHYGGYGKVNNEITDYIKYFAKQFGVLLDPIYTSKMMLATIELIKSGEIEQDKKVLCLHTGGVTGLLSEKMMKKF